MTATLQGFFILLASGAQPTAFPVALRRIASRVLWQPMADFDLDDLVGEFLLRVVEATRRGGSGSAQLLVGLEEPELHALTRFRMRQIVAERSGARRAVKQLRDAVRRAQEVGLPPPGEALPPSIFAKGRLHGPSVAAAVAVVVTTADAPVASDVAGIVDRLQELYVWPGVPAFEPHTVEVEAMLDAGSCVEQLRTSLTSIDFGLLRRRLAGESLAAIAASEGAAVSTAHGQVGRSLGAVRRVVGRLGIDAAAMERALQLLAA